MVLLQVLEVGQLNLLVPLLAFWPLVLLLQRPLLWALFLLLLLLLDLQLLRLLQLLT
jgi:hypothetical protein